MKHRTALLASLILAAACSSSSESDPEPSVGLAPDSAWPKFRGDAAQTGRGRYAPSEVTGGTYWEVKTGKGIFSSAVIGGDGTSYIGSADRSFYAIDRGGEIKWKIDCGEIVDSSALLDDKGRLYFGSGDSKLRAVDAATGHEIWTFTADDPKTNGAFINWFEGNVAIGAGGTLYVPNDDFFLYAIDRDTGAVRWKFKTPDQTWSLPAVDARSGKIFVGNNNVLPILGANTYALMPDGTPAWTGTSLGSVAASPMIAGDRVIVGGFDGYIRAYGKESGDVLWEVPTRDHVYASAALMNDGTVVEPSADGTVYAIDPATGAIRWTFDIDDPIRSSPAIDKDGNVYFGGGDGRLWVLNPDGTLRWSLLLVDDARNDVNASPSLGPDGIVIAAESGQVFGVPYDFCLRAGAGDKRCSTLPASRADIAELRFVSEMGSMTEVPAISNANDAFTFAIDVRKAGKTALATLDAASISVETTPHVDLEIHVAGDGKFVTFTPKTSLPSDVDVTITGKYLIDHDRSGLRLTNGKVGGDVSRTVHLHTEPRADVTLAPGATWEVSRLALPLPTILPSYNQIGFDSLHWLLGVVELDHDHGVAWMIGAQPGGIPDPTTRALFPLELAKDGDLVTFGSASTLRVEVMNVVIPFDAFRISARLGTDANALGLASMTGGTKCAGVPFYGPFLQTLGLCNPTTDELVVAGASNLHAMPPSQMATSDVTFTRDASQVRATMNSGVRASEHVTGVLLVDADTNKPVVLDYGAATTRELDSEGRIRSVTIPFGGKAVPKNLRAHFLVDTSVVATHALAAE